IIVIDEILDLQYVINCFKSLTHKRFRRPSKMFTAVDLIRLLQWLHELWLLIIPLVAAAIVVDAAPIRVPMVMVVAAGATMPATSVVTTVLMLCQR
ncbi:MAG TPA: hypothetical protein VJY33_05960, partial [Isosphaeraceae bacterium]|nr:hypothetical protein [Isosphaeraceae bacterium]